MVSDEQDPAHRYDHAGVYDVSLLVSNLYGNATLTKHGVISVMGGTYQTALLPSRGIEIVYSESGPLLELNPLLAGNCSFNPESNPELIFCIPDNESGIAQLSFSSKNGTGFSYTDNETITGLLGQVAVSSSDLVPENFSQKVGTNSRFNYTVSLSDYPKEGRIQLVAWEGSTPEDFTTFANISREQGYISVANLAYTVRFESENITDMESAMLIFGVSSDWVEQYGWRWSNSIESDPSGAEVYVDNHLIGLTPIAIEEGFSPGNHTITLVKSGYRDEVSLITVDDKRNHIHVVRIGDDGAGEVLNTTFIGHDQERNLDYFMAESPNGLSTFGLASLSRSGNIFRLFYLIIATNARPQTGGSGGGGGGVTSSGLTSLVASATPAPTQTKGTTLTPIPTITPKMEETGPKVTGSQMPTPPPTTPSEQPTTPSEGNGNGDVPAVMVLLRNLAVISVVIIITVIFYFKWRKKEE
jgi:PKD repeat protein